jgi:uncharacterized protein YukE
VAVVSGDGAVQFPVAAVQQHAGTVDQVADAVQEARSAVREVSMDTQAYGQLCQFLPGLLSPLFGLALVAMNGAVDALQETATNLRAAASHAEATDTANAARVTAAGGALPGLKLPL